MQRILGSFKDIPERNLHWLLNTKTNATTILFQRIYFIAEGVTENNKYFSYFHTFFFTNWDLPYVCK